MDKSVNINLSNLVINQLGYLYKDAEKQAKVMETKYNIPKFAVLDNQVNKIKYRGKDSEIVVKIVFSRFLNKQIELIQWIEGDCIFKEFIESGQEGLHHFGIFVEDLQSYIDYFNSNGFEIIHSGNIGKQYFVYIDSLESFGIYLEFQETLKRRKK